MTSDDRLQKTRRPLDLRNSTNVVMYVFLTLGFPLAGAYGLLLHPDFAWQRAIGALLLIAVAVELVLFVRWLRRPIDPEALIRRDRERERLHPQQTRIPDRSKW